jgi:phage portal protein BeeE
LTVLTEGVCRTRWLWQNAAGDPLPAPLWVTDPMLTGGSPGSVWPQASIGRRVDGHQFWVTVVADAVLHGRGVFVLQEAADGTPLPGSLMRLNPYLIRVDKTGRFVINAHAPAEEQLTTDTDGRFSLAGQTWRVASLETGWEDPPRGVLHRHADTLRLGVNLSGYIERLFEDGVPAGILSVSTPNFGLVVDDPDHPGETVREDVLLKRRWQQANGLGRASTAVLNSAVAYTPISVSPLDAEAVRLSAAARSDVALCFGLDPVWVGEATGGLTYSNASERRADLVSTTLSGLGQRLMDLLSSLMPFGTTVAVHWPSFISGSLEAIAPSVVQLVQAGVLNGAEARQLLGITPWIGPDPGYVDLTPASGHRPEPAAPPATPEEEA